MRISYEGIVPTQYDIRRTMPYVEVREITPRDWPDVIYQKLSEKTFSFLVHGGVILPVKMSVCMC